MPHRERRWMVSVLALALMLGACGSRSPEAWRPSVHAVQRNPRGSWVDIEIDDGRRAYGELLAIDPVREIAYLEMRGTLARVPRSRIRRLELTFYEGQTGRTVAWGLTGAVSTLSHGFWLILTVPVWLLNTGIASGIESSAGTMDYDRDPRGRGSLTAKTFVELRKYARFPQGLPEGFTLSPANAPSPTAPAASPAPPSTAPVPPVTAPAPPSTAPMPPVTAPAPRLPDTAPDAPAQPAQPAAPPSSRPPGR